MLKHKPLTIDWLAVSAHIPIVIFIAPQKMTHRFAHVLDSLVRVSRRVKWSITFMQWARLAPLPKETMGHSTQQQKPSCIPCKDIFTTCTMQGTYACLVLACSFTMACKARYTVYPHKHRNAHNMHPAWCQQTAILLNSIMSFAFIPAISGTCNFLFKVLFTFPSWYLYTISLKHIFSFTWNLPPALHSNSKEHDSWEHTLHESLHMTHKSFTFVATFSQLACTHTFISNTTLKYNSKHKVRIVNVSSSWFIRHY